MSHQLNKHNLERFKGWLIAQGATLLNPTNQYEVLRFEHRGVTSIIYKNAKGAWSSMVGDAAGAIKAFTKGRSWTTEAIRAPLGTAKRAKYVTELLARDGNRCFFCNRIMQENELSIEHLVPRVHGGPHHLSNLALAHRDCNQQAGHLSAVEKIALREKNIKKGVDGISESNHHAATAKQQENNSVATF